MGKEALSMISRANMDLEVSRVPNALHNAQGGVGRPNTTSPACSSVRSVAGSAFVFLRAIMVTKLFALATTTGRPRKVDQNALKLHHFINHLLSSFYQLYQYDDIIN
ncbi:hypothetical protein PIB30_047109 [Stylosanthes scabra]|uniref:Uncharacterized protein n=1 Tax=Stylosanthes scabra TaxID=79078 RepID=A0ABU6RGY3_9FABA|nr:hypothetical protein [Stylosanthes scabra]